MWQIEVKYQAVGCNNQCLEMRINCTEFVPIDLGILPLLQQWPVLDAVSHTFQEYNTGRELNHQYRKYMPKGLDQKVLVKLTLEKIHIYRYQTLFKPKAKGQRTWHFQDVSTVSPCTGENDPMGSSLKKITIWVRKLCLFPSILHP